MSRNQIPRSRVGMLFWCAQRLVSEQTQCRANPDLERSHSVHQRLLLVDELDKERGRLPGLAAARLGASSACAGLG
jgi:hypothetical protein